MSEQQPLLTSFDGSFNMAVLFESLKICEYLEKLLKDTFGPCGLDVLLNSSSGKILITNSGSVIVDSLCVGHPVANVVVDKIKSHNDITGDGSSAFIIVLTQALREITKLLEVNSPAELKAPTLQAMIALSKHLMRIQDNLDSLVEPTLHKISVVIDIMKDDETTIKDTLTYVINTCMNGKFSSSIQKLLASLLVKVITNSFSLGADLYADVVSLLDDFNNWCIDFHGMPVRSSYIDEGFMIPRELATGQEITLPGPGKTYFTFVIIQCSLSFDKSVGSAEIEINDLSTYSKTLVHNQTTTLSVLKAFKEQDIDVIISSESVSEMALHHCRQLGLAVIQMVPLETINYMCKRVNIQPFCSLNRYDIQHISSDFKARGTYCKQKIIGGQKHVKLCIPHETCKVYHIVLYGPTLGVIKQYRITLQNALKLIKMSFSESRTSLTLLPGCGSTEFVLSQVFDQIARSATDGNMKTACDVLCKSLLQIPRILHKNSHQSGDKNYMRVQQTMTASWKEGKLLGVDGRTGGVINPYTSHIYEPYHSKILWMSHLLQSLAMLLKVDKIVGVKCPDNKDTLKSL